MEAVAIITLVVAVLALLVVRDWEPLIRRMKIIGVGLGAALLALVIATVHYAIYPLLPTSYRQLSIPDGMEGPVAGAGCVLIGLYFLWLYIRKKRRPPPNRKGDPGDYKLGWGEPLD